VEISYKIAPLGRVANIRVTNDEIMELRPNGDVRQSVSFADLKQARWTFLRQKGSSARTLALKDEKGSFKLVLSSPTRGFMQSEHSDAFNQALGACLDKIEAARPDFRVTIGAPPIVQWVYFFGFIGIAIVLLVPSVQLLTGRNADEFWWVSLILGACMVGALYFAFTQRPWQEELTMTPSELRAEIQAGRMG
jgi:hypothetical protein